MARLSREPDPHPSNRCREHARTFEQERERTVRCLFHCDVLPVAISRSSCRREYRTVRVSNQRFVNHDRPVSLYLVVPLASRDRLRPLIRLILNQIVRTLTTTMTYRNGRAVANYKHPLLLMLDEFPVLGRLEVFAEALSLIAGYGLRACLIAQDLSQIHAAYGHDESITSNCNTRVAFTPNRIE